MATNPTQTPAPAGPSLLDVLAASRQRLGVGVLALGAALAAIPIFYGFRQGWGAVEVIVWGAFLSLACLAAGAALLALQPRPNWTEADQVRLVLVGLGAAAGCATTLLGLILPVTRYLAVFSGGLTEWKKNPWPIWTCAAAIFGGLGLMYLSLYLARAVERTNALMRRLVYGYNAFFASFLLLAVLVLINVLGYTPLPVFRSLQTTYDWTANEVYTLQEPMRKQLTALKKPVRVLLLLSDRDGVLPDMETMLKDCREVTPKIQAERLDPEQLQPEAQAQLAAKYSLPDPANIAGMVVQYGEDPDVSYAFVKRSQLFEAPMSSPEEQSSSKKYTFKGEAALSSAIDYLESGKAKAIIYFSQGHGEAALEGGFRTRPDDSLATLAANLNQGNYEVRPLRLDDATKEIPADAGVVVIARPLAPLPEAAVTALRKYLEGSNGKRGRLIALLNGVTTAGAPVSDPRLEQLLADYNVSLGHDRIVRVDDRILSATPIPPTLFQAAPDPEGGNPIAEGMMGAFFLFRNAQTVAPAQPATHPQTRTVTIVQTQPRGADAYISLKDFRADPVQVARQAFRNIQQGQADPTQQKPISVGVAVTSGGAPEVPPGHPPIPGGDEPVMAVFGDATWVTDAILEGDPRLAGEHFSLFKSTLDWLREKATIGDQGRSIKPAEREEFSMNKIDAPTSWAVEFAPGFVMLAGVLALGFGVALVRRS